VLLSSAQAQFGTLQEGDGIIITRELSSGRIVVVFECDTLGIRQEMLQRLLDSTIAVSGGSVDTTQFVSMDRDDNISGEKDFLGDISAANFVLGAGTAVLASIPDITDNALFHRCDTASLKSTDYIYKIAPTSATPPYGGTVFAIHESGIIQRPRNSAIRVYRSSTQSTTGSAANKILWNAETYDTQYEHDPSGTVASVFTATEDGIYTVHSKLQHVASSSHQIYLTIKRNGTLISMGPVVQSRYAGGSNYAAEADVSDIVKLTAGQYLEIQAFPTVSGYVNSGEYNSYFTVSKIQ